MIVKLPAAAVEHVCVYKPNGDVVREYGQNLESVSLENHDGLMVAITTKIMGEFIYRGMPFEVRFKTGAAAESERGKL